MGKRHSGKKRERLIELVRTSGEPVKVVADRMGVSVSTAYLWMRRAPASKPAFARVVHTAHGKRLTVVVGEASIQLEPGFDPELLQQVVSTLAQVQS